MPNVYSEIKDKLQKLCHSNESALILAEVKQVDNTTCTVAIDDLELSDVRLRAVVNEEESGIVVTPKVGSMVMITDLSHGKMRDWAVIMYSEIDNITINGGKNGGLINIEDLVSHLNTLEDDINNLKTAISGWVTVPQDGGAALKTALSTWVGSTITKTKTSDIEDDKITH